MITASEKSSVCRRAWLGVVFAFALLSFAGVLLPAAARAQDTVDFISNIGQTATSSSLNSGDETDDEVEDNLWAQAFTTGSNMGGYTLSSIQLKMGFSVGSDGSWTVEVRTDRGGEPSDTVLHTFPDPGSHTQRMDSTFTAPSNAHLSANTTYYIVVSPPTDGELSGVSTSRGEDMGTAAGWSFPQGYQYLTVQSFGEPWTEEGEPTPDPLPDFRFWSTVGDRRMMVKITGTLRTQTNPPSIEVRGIDNNPIASGTTTVSTASGTDFGEVALVNDDGSDGYVERVFTIANTASSGGGDLSLPSGVFLVGVGAKMTRPVGRTCHRILDPLEALAAFHARCPEVVGEYEEFPVPPRVNTPFSIQSQPPSTIAANDTGTFTVRFNPQRRGGGLGGYEIDLLVPSNDPESGAHRFRLRGRVRLTEAEMRITDSSGRNLRAAGNRNFDFGMGNTTPQDEVITIRNAGDYALHLGMVTIVEYVPEDPLEDTTDYSVFVDDYSVTVQPAPPAQAGDPRTVAPGASTTFTIRYTPDGHRLARAVARIAVFNDPNLRPICIAMCGSSTPEFETEPALRLELRGRGPRQANVDATGTPIITVAGEVQIDQVLTAGLRGMTDDERIMDDNGLMDVIYRYQWQRADDDAGTNLVNIPGATRSTYIMVEEDIRKRLRVTLSFMDDAGYPEARSSDYTDFVRGRMNTAAQGSPTIAGTASVGRTLTGSRGRIHDPNGMPPSAADYSYQWLRGDSATTPEADLEEIGDGTTTYTLVDADNGKFISLRVSFVDRRGNPESRTSDTPVMVNTSATGAPSITGTAQVGRRLTAVVPGSIEDANGGVPTGPEGYFYRWFIVETDGSNPVSVGGGNRRSDSDGTNSYFLDDRSVGKRMRLEVEYYDSAGFREVVTSADYPATGSVEAAPITEAPDDTTLGPIGISGDGRLGQMLSVSGVDASWSTLANYAALTGAADGARLLFWSRCEQADCKDAADISTRVVGTAGALTYTPATPVVAGDYVQVQALDLRTPTSGSMTPVPELQRRAIFGPVCATGATDCGAKQVFPRLPNQAAVGTPTITGAARVGMTLTAAPGVITDGNGGVPDAAEDFAYQWQRLNADGTPRGTPVSPHSRTYTLAPSDMGMKVLVTVIFTDADGYTERVSSDAFPAASTIEAGNVPATGLPTISGANSGVNVGAVGDVLTADITAIADMDGLPTGMNAFSYQWLYENATPIPGAADTNTYTLAASDVDRRVRVRVRFTDDRGFAEQRLSNPYPETGLPVKVVNSSMAGGMPTITGSATARVGVRLQAVTPGSITDGNGLTRAVYRYQWERADDDVGAGVTNIAGAITSSYLPTGDDEEKFLRVTVRFDDDDGYPEQRSSAYTAEVMKSVNTPATGRPTFSGTHTVGRELTAQFRGISDANGGVPQDVSGYSYQWQRGTSASDMSPVDIPTGATERRYTLVKADEAMFVRVRVRFTDADDYEETLLSPYSSAVARRPQSPATGQVRIIGARKVGETLTVDTAGIIDANGVGTSFTYQWQRGEISSGAGPTAEFTFTDSDSSDATSSSYRLTGDDLDHFMRVTVGYTDGDSYTESITSRITAAVEESDNRPATGRPTLTGEAKVGGTLTVSTTGIADADGPALIPLADFSYQWQRVDAAGANLVDVGDGSTTYTPDEDDLAGRIRVQVSFMDERGNAEMLTSAPTALVSAAANNLATGAPTFEGMLQVGETLMVVTTGISDADGLGDFSYQWQREQRAGADPVNIASATGESYTLQRADRDRRVRVRVSFTDAADNDEERTSALVGPVMRGPNIPATGTPKIVGLLRAAETLTVDTSDIADENGPPSPIPPHRFDNYQWQREETPGAEPVNIAGATSPSYTLTAADVGQRVRVQLVLADLNFDEDLQNFEGPFFSELSDVVIAATASFPSIPATGAPTILGASVAKVGIRLAAETSQVADEDGLSDPTFSYQWQREETGGAVPVDIPGANADTYTLVKADQDRRVRVRVRFQDDDSNDEELFSELTNVVEAGENRLATGAVTLTGMDRAGQTLTVDTSAIRDANGLDNVVYTYTWWRISRARGEQQIEGASQSTYTLQTVDQEWLVYADVAFQDDDGNNEQASTGIIGPVLAASGTANTKSTGIVLITGTPQVDGLLTANTSNITDDNGPASPIPEGRFSYQWRRADDENGTGAEDISSNGTSQTYTPVDTDEDKHLQVVATFMDADAYTESRASDWVGPVAAGLLTNAPTLDAIDNQEVRIGETLTFTVTATDPNTEQEDLVFTLRSDAPQGARISQGGEFTWAPVHGQLGRHRITVQVSDARAGAEYVDDTDAFDVLVRPDAETVEQVVEGAAPSLAALSRSLAVTTVNVIGTRFAAPQPSQGVVIGGRTISGAAGGAELLRGAAAAFGVHLPSPGGVAAQAEALAGSAPGAGPSFAPGESRVRATQPPAFPAVRQGAARQSSGAGGAYYGRGAADAAAVGAAKPVLHSPSLRELLSRSAFEFTLSGGGEGAAPGVFAFWGRGEVGGFENNSEQGLRYDGDVSSGHAGFDYRRENMLLGIAMTFSESEVDYTASGLSGTVESELTVFTPYASWALADGLDLHGAIGYGTGDAEVRPDDSNATALAEPDLEMLMATLGFSRGLSGVGSLNILLKGDALLVRFSSEAADGFPEMDAESERFRVAMEGTGPLFAGRRGDTVNGTLELGARYDSGDVEQGAGIELGGGLSYRAPRLGLTIGGSGRLLVLHTEDDYEEWGASLEARMDPGTVGRGISASLRPAWGDVQSGVDAMFEEEYALSRKQEERRTSRSSAMPDRMDFELGYGVGMLGGRALLSPFGKLGFAPGDAHRLRLGARFAFEGREARGRALGDLAFEFFGERRHLSGGAIDGRVGLDLRFDF